MFIDTFILGALTMERRIIPIQSLPVPIFLEYTPQKSTLALLQNNLDAENNSKERKDSGNGKLLFGVAKYVALPTGREASVSDMIWSAGPIDMAPHTS